MTADQPRRLKRGVLIGAVAVAVLAIVAIVVILQARRVERSADALCARLREAQDLDQSFTTLDPATLDPQLAALERAKAVAPEDIQGQLATLADFVDAVATQVEESTDDRDQALTTALADRQDQIDTITAAGQAVQAWAQTNCGLALTGNTDTSAPPTTGG